jgi:hypothetical protein
LVKAFVVACWIAAALALWTQRERAYPLLDQYQLWRDVNWSPPPPLPRMEATVVRPLSEAMVQIKAADGRLWNVGLLGVGTNNLPITREGIRWNAEARTNLAQRLAGRSVEFAWTQTNVTRTALGFVYVDGTNHLLGAVRDGLLVLKPEDARVLPMGEQYRLRVADRAARADGAGRWGLTNSPPEPR